MRRTKIVATVGPASRAPEVLEQLVDAGVNVFRLNFSHGVQEQHLEVIEAARAIAERRDLPLALLQDLSGPKIRTGRVRGGQIELVEGARVEITTDESIEGTPERISTSYDPLPRDVVPGDRILLDDGNLELRVVAAAGDTVTAEVVYGGPLKSNKGMNLPGVNLSTPALTEKDLRDLAFGVKHGVDYVALSFVRSAADVALIKTHLAALGAPDLPVIAKIEKREAINDLAAILEATDGVMVARGDLGVELSTEEVPTLQKRIIEMANGAGKVVITATQMLESMIDNPRPTRAEASDVANAILDGTDAIMLSAETASGRFPVEAVETMARIARYTEENYGFGRHRLTGGGQGSMVARALARVAATVADELDCRLVVAFTESGTTARLVSSVRPRAPIAAVTHHLQVFRRLALWWGIVPVRCAYVETTDEMMVRGEAVLLQRELVSKGDTVLMLAGQGRTGGATNMLRVHTVA